MVSVCAEPGDEMQGNPNDSLSMARLRTNGALLSKLWALAHPTIVSTFLPARKNNCAPTILQKAFTCALGAPFVGQIRPTNRGDSPIRKGIQVTEEPTTPRPPASPHNQASNTRERHLYDHTTKVQQSGRTSVVTETAQLERTASPGRSWVKTAGHPGAQDGQAPHISDLPRPPFTRFAHGGASQALVLEPRLAAARLPERGARPAAGAAAARGLGKRMGSRTGGAGGEDRCCPAVPHTRPRPGLLALVWSCTR